MVINSFRNQLAPQMVPIVGTIAHVALSANVMRMATSMAALLFLLYLALVGLLISSIFALYNNDQIYSVFFITSVVTLF